MRKSISRYQLSANRRNGSLSTGPKTLNGKEISKMNAMKHGLRSAEVIVRGRCIKESRREFEALRQRLWEDLEPVGLLEEIQADIIITTYWRQRRVLKAESGEIALSVDNGEWQRKKRDISLITMEWEIFGDPAGKMRESAFGNSFLYHQLQDVRDSVEKEGELTEAAVQSVMYKGKPFSLTNELEKLRLQLQQNHHGLDATALQAKQKEDALVFLNRKLRMISRDADKCELREKTDEESHEAADVLPSAATLEKLLRYESVLQKKLYRAMNHLERLQRRRKGENVPAPVAMEISTGT